MGLDMFYRWHDGFYSDFCIEERDSTINRSAPAETKITEVFKWRPERESEKGVWEMKRGKKEGSRWVTGKMSNYRKG